MKLPNFEKKQLRLFFLIFGFCFITISGIAQTATISGTVEDQDGVPLMGATVVVERTKDAVITDENGAFTLSNVSIGARLLVSYVGFQTKYVSASENMTVVLSIGLLDEVIITAQKRTEDAQRIPISVGVVGAAEIAQTGNNDLSAIINNVPSVEVQGLAQGAQVYVRGIGSSIDPTFADPAVALMVDGVYNGRTESVSGGVFDLERVEVLRGPQGTLYGRNASGGSINMITANPEMRNTGYVRGQFGNYALWKIEAMGNFKLADNLAFRVAGFKQKRDGYVDDGSYNADNYGGRAKLLWQISDKVSVLAKADFYREGGTGSNTVPVAGSGDGNLFFPPPFFVENFDPTQNPPFVGGPPILRFPNGWQTADANDPWANNLEHPPGLIDRKSDTYALQIDADLGFSTLTILPAYTRNKNRLVSSFLFGSILPFQGPTFDTTGYGDQESDTRYTSIEARLVSNENPESNWKYLVGLYYLKSDGGDAELPGTSITSSGQMLETNNILQPNTTFAGFGQVTYSFSDAFRLNAGLRLSHDKTGQQYSLAIDGNQNPPVDFEQSIDNFQYKLGFEYDMAEKSMLYGHVSTGFKQGGISPTFPPTKFEPEELTAYEIGTKNRFLKDRMLLNASLFHYSYKNYQFSSFQTQQVGDQDATADFIVIGNAGKTNITGLELETETFVWKGGQLSLAATYLDAKYGEAILPNNPFVNQGDYNLEGTQIQNAPELVWDLGFEQRFNLGDAGLFAGIRTHISSGYYTTPEQYLPGAYQDNYSRTDLSLRYAKNNNRWSISAWLRNLENDAQTTYVFPVYRRLITSPLTAGVNLEYNF